MLFSAVVPTASASLVASTRVFVICYLVKPIAAARGSQLLNQMVDLASKYSILVFVVRY